MAKINSIETLHQSGHSNREIARILGVDRGAVNRYVRDLKAREAQKGPNPQTGSEGQSDEVPKPVPEPNSGPPSQCDSYREQILAKLELGLSVKRIHQDLQADHGFGGSYHSVRRLSRKHSTVVRHRNGYNGLKAIKFTLRLIVNRGRNHPI